MKSSRGTMARLVLALLTAVPVNAVAQPAADVAAATAVVMSQLDAFRRGDFDTAYGFASAMIRDRFDRASFEQMVRTGYPEIGRSASAYVAGSRAGSDGALYLALKIRGANGNAIEAVYEVVPEDGAFRINGVVTRPDGVSASTSPSRRRSSSDGNDAPPNRARS